MGETLFRFLDGDSRHFESALASEQAGRLLRYLKKQFAYCEAVRAGEWVATALQKVQPLSTKNDAYLLNQLGQSYYRLGNPQKAAACFEHALEIDISASGKRHSNTARDYNNLALAWSGLGEYQRAADCCRKAIDIWEDESGKNTSLIAEGLSNLGVCWVEYGYPEKAVDCFRQSLNIDKKCFGPWHPKTAVRMNNLGTAYLELRNLPLASEYFKGALNTIVATFNEDDSFVAVIKENLSKCTPGKYQGFFAGGKFLEVSQE